jgi:6-phosphofructokinase 1
MRIGVLTGGGDCPGLNAVIRAVFKTSFNNGWDVIGIEDGFEGLLDPTKSVFLSPEKIHGILPLGGTIFGTSNMPDPFEQSLNDPTLRSSVEKPTNMLKNIQELGLNAVIAIGGDGTLTISQGLFQMGGPLIGIPKTIDNDIPGTDVTLGFRTAVETVTQALDRLHSTAESHHRIFVVEVMGRYGGWIALEAGMAGGADIILIPEIPFEMEKIQEKIQSQFEKGRKCCLIVVAEGSKPLGGGMSVLKKSESGYVLRLEGVGKKVGEEISRKTGKDVRVTVLGHLQRGGSPCSFDRILGTRFGTAAIELIKEGGFGKMVCLKTPHITSVPLQEAVKELKTVPPHGGLVNSAEALGISLGR